MLQIPPGFEHAAGHVPQSVVDQVTKIHSQLSQPHPQNLPALFPTLPSTSALSGLEPVRNTGDQQRGYGRSIADFLRRLTGRNR